MKDVTAVALVKRILKLSKKDQEYLLAKKQAMSIKLKSLEDNIEEYNNLYADILKSSPKPILRIADERDVAIKKATFTLFETAKEYWQKQNLANIYQQQMQERLSNLEIDNQKLRQFHEVVKTSLYYKIYKRLRSYRLYKLAKHLKPLLTCGK